MFILEAEGELPSHFRLEGSDVGLVDGLQACDWIVSFEESGSQRFSVEYVLVEERGQVGSDP